MGQQPDAERHLDNLEVSDSNWALAVEREAIIRPLADLTLSTAEVQEACDVLEISKAQLYRMLRLYRAAPRTATLVPHRRGTKVGHTHLTAEQEAVVRREMETFFLQKQKPKPSQLVRNIAHACRAAGVTPPAESTIRKRIASIPEEQRLRAREGDKAADDKFRPVKSSFEADQPLSIVQIDHTLADVIVVDDESRLPVGRPWLSLAIDVCTRMVAGLYLSLEAPSATSLAMVMLHSIFPKDQWLADHGVEAPWPVCGLPIAVHSDNGKDFRSKGFERGCIEFGIKHILRPPKTPHFGGHIERLVGSFMGEIHLVPGSTFSDIKQRGGYDSKKAACMTTAELQQWLAIQALK
jgi:putative transposase